MGEKQPAGRPWPILIPPTSSAQTKKKLIPKKSVKASLCQWNSRWLTPISLYCRSTWLQQRAPPSGKSSGLRWILATRLKWQIPLAVGKSETWRRTNASEKKKVENAVPKAVCLTRQQSITLFKEYDIKRHFSTKHANYATDLSSKEKKKTVASALCQDNKSQVENDPARCNKRPKLWHFAYFISHICPLGKKSCPPQLQLKVLWLIVSGLGPY